MKVLLKRRYFIYCLPAVLSAILYMGCFPPHPGNIEEYEKKNMATDYINFPRNEAEIENNRRVEKKFIDLAPMYGYAKKNVGQQVADKQFIDFVLSKYSRADGCKKTCDEGWYYFKEGNSELASKRFNEAFLLDSTNYIIYWGFADIMGRQHRFEESFALYEKADSYCKKKDDSTYAFFCLDYSLPLYGKYMDTKQKEYIDKAFNLLDIANKLHPEYATTYVDYSHLYFATAQYQKALDAYTKSVSLHHSYADTAFQKAIIDSLKR